MRNLVPELVVTRLGQLKLFELYFWWLCVILQLLSEGHYMDRRPSIDFRIQGTDWAIKEEHMKKNQASMNEPMLWFDHLQIHGNVFLLFDEERYFTRPGNSNVKKRKRFPHPLRDSTQKTAVVAPARVDLRLTTDLWRTFSGLSLGFVLLASSQKQSIPK